MWACVWTPIPDAYLWQSLLRPQHLPQPLPIRPGVGRRRKNRGVAERRLGHQEVPGGLEDPHGE